MSIPGSRGIRNVARAFALALASASLLSVFSMTTYSDQGVILAIKTDKRVYPPGAHMRVRFLVTNTSNASIYLFSNIHQCSSPLGWLSLHVRDPHNREVRSFACAVDYDMDNLDPAQQLADSKYGLLLRTNQIFGMWQDYELPKEKGVYRLQGEIGRVGSLNGAQEKALADHQMQILRHNYYSSVIAVEIR